MVLATANANPSLSFFYSPRIAAEPAFPAAIPISAPRYVQSAPLVYAAAPRYVAAPSYVVAAPRLALAQPAIVAAEPAVAVPNAA